VPQPAAIVTWLGALGSQSDPSGAYVTAGGGPITLPRRRDPGRPQPWRGTRQHTWSLTMARSTSGLARPLTHALVLGWTQVACHWPASPDPGATHMDHFFVSTTSVAVGELGDKTQLLSVILATRLLLQRESIDTGRCRRRAAFAVHARSRTRLPGSLRLRHEHRGRHTAKVQDRLGCRARASVQRCRPDSLVTPPAPRHCSVCT
jgi:hypothetical protein